MKDDRSGGRLLASQSWRTRLTTCVGFLKLGRGGRALLMALRKEVGCLASYGSGGRHQGADNPCLPKATGCQGFSKDPMHPDDRSDTSGNKPNRLSPSHTPFAERSHHMSKRDRFTRGVSRFLLVPVLWALVSCTDSVLAPPGESPASRTLTVAVDQTGDSITSCSLVEGVWVCTTTGSGATAQGDDPEDPECEYIGGVLYCPSADGG